MANLLSGRRCFGLGFNSFAVSIEHLQRTVLRHAFTHLLGIADNDNLEMVQVDIIYIVLSTSTNEEWLMPKGKA
jgi:hypothetical protein